MTRRELLDAAAAAAAPADAAPGGVPRRRLGRTGETVSLVGLGGYHLGLVATEGEAVRMVRTAVDGGLTFLDNCWDYHRGLSEERMGKALRSGYRERAFLMTKIDGRDRATATRQLDESLRRLRTDRLDLLQLHEVIRDSDVDRAFERGGAMEALLEAKQAGKARFLGFTGHKSPAIHLRMLRAALDRGFPLDAVQLPLNVLDAHHDSFEQGVLPLLLERGIAPLGMKPLGAGALLAARAISAEEGLRYAMSLPVSVTITGCESVPQVEQALRIARGFRPLDEAEMEALLARSAPAAAGGRHERYKTTAEHDGTAESPEYLGRRAARAL